MQFLFNIQLCLVVFCLKAIIAPSPCDKKPTCRDCILESNDCRWCSSTNKLSKDNCASIKDISKDWCNVTEIENPQSSCELSKNNDFSSDNGSITQIKPQAIKMKLRIGDTKSFNFSYSAFYEYPVDIYFLVDASLTMYDTKQAIATRSTEIFDSINNNLTKDVFVGLGTFIDKKALPFTSFTSKLTYSFKHHLSITKDINEFKRRVNEIEFGENFDEPESGFDALSQIMACTKEIGWRKVSRKVILYFSDGLYHAAGDGMLAGIYKPHDGKCYMENNTYSKELELDYPSVSLINKLASKEEIIIVFVLTKDDNKDMYESLVKSIKGSHLLQLKPQHIVNALSSKIKSISKSLALETRVLNKNVENRHVEINITSEDCPTKQKNPECNNIQRGTKVDFNATIKILQYNEIDNFKVEIRPIGLNERLTLDIDVINQCECAKMIETNASRCYEGGSLICGMCDCYENRYGENCRCTREQRNKMNDSLCIDEYGLKCSGKGDCVCGKCKCVGDFYGQYCNCHDNTCPGSLNKLPCSGHGKCHCGHCICDEGWARETCDCTMSKDLCKNPVSSEICSHRGTCECGKCICKPPPSWDAREIDENHCGLKDYSDPISSRRQCEYLINCAMCYYYKKNESNRDCLAICDELIIPLFVNSSDSTANNWISCPDIKTSVGCYVSFYYQYSGINIKILIPEKSNCAESFYMYGGISLVVVVVIGLLTLVAWKLITNARDKREYMEFKKQYESAMWPETNNPVYEPAVAIFSNPTFGCQE